MSSAWPAAVERDLTHGVASGWSESVLGRHGTERNKTRIGFGLTQRLRNRLNFTGARHDRPARSAQKDSASTPRQDGDVSPGISHARPARLVRMHDPQRLEGRGLIILRSVTRRQSTAFAIALGVAAAAG